MEVNSLAQGAYSLATYLASVKDGGKERERLIEELEALGLALEDFDAAHGDQSWSENVQFSQKLNGVVEKIRQKLNDLHDKFMPRKGVEQVVQTLKWPLDKADGEREVQHVIRLFQLLTNVQVRANFTAMSEGELRSVCDWLSPLNALGTQQSKFKQACAGTGKWFLDSRVYRSWKDDRGSILWCPGIPGAGKSVLSSIVVDNLQELRRSGLDPKIAVLTIYFAFDDANSQSPDLILGSLLKQVLQSRATRPGRVLKKFQEHRRHGTRPAQEELVSVLKFELAEFEHIYIVMDGLDELQEEKRRSLIESVIGLNEKTNLLVTSRLVDSIRDIFGCPVSEVLYCHGCEAQFCLPSNSAFDPTKTGSLEPHQFFYHCLGCKEDLDLCHTCYDKGDDSRKGLVFVRRYCSLRQDISANEGDLRSYIEWRIESQDELKHSASRKEGLRDLIFQRVSESARGMFLQAKFHMNSLAEQLTPGGIIKALETLPTEIDETYKSAMERIAMERIDPRYKEQVKVFLMWVAYSHGHLSTHAIEHATVVATLTSSDSQIDPDEIIRAQKLASMCGGLVIIDEAQNVGLCHYTAEEYFRKNRDELFPNSKVTLARACLKYLLLLPEIGGNQDANFPFLPYVALFWTRHCLENPYEEGDRIVRGLTNEELDRLVRGSRGLTREGLDRIVRGGIGRGMTSKDLGQLVRGLTSEELGWIVRGGIGGGLTSEELDRLDLLFKGLTSEGLGQLDRGLTSEELDLLFRGLTSEELGRLDSNLRELTSKELGPLDGDPRGVTSKELGRLDRSLTREELDRLDWLVGRIVMGGIRRGLTREELGRLHLLFGVLTSEELCRLDWLLGRIVRGGIGSDLTREELGRLDQLFRGLTSLGLGWMFGFC